MKKIAILLASSVVVSCASLSDKANDLYDKGSYNEAVEMYERAVVKDPSDAEAVAGLKKARLMVIDTQLIEVRKLRMSGNSDLQLSRLEDVLAKEQKWQVFPGGPVAFTQDEEIKEGQKVFESKIQNSISRRLPLQTKLLLKDYKAMFGTLPEGRKRQVDAQLKGVGNQSCQDLQHGADARQPYFANFVKKFCQYFQSSTQNYTVPTVGARSWKNVDLKLEMNNAVSSDMLRKKLSEKLAQTAWYDPSAQRTVPVQLRGSLFFERNQASVSLVKEYTEYESYVETEYQTRYHDVPGTEVYSYTDSYGNPQTGVRPITRQETYTEAVPVTKSRPITKYFPYVAWKYEQAAKINLAGEALLAQDKLPLTFEDEMHDSQIVHDVNMPAVGLFPQRLTMPGKEQWVGLQYEQLADKFKSQLAQRWDELYCDRPASATPDGEAVFQCFRSQGMNSPKFVDDWFRGKLGVSLAQAETLLQVSSLSVTR